MINRQPQKGPTELFNDPGKIEVTESDRASWEDHTDKTGAEMQQELILPFSSIKEIANFILDRAKELTGSPHGFVSVVNLHTGDHVGYTQTKMLNNEGQVENTNQKFAFPRGSDGYYPGLWGASLNSGKAFYNNAAASHANSSDALARPISWERFLSVPVLLGSQVVGQIALADAETDYTDKDLNTLQPLVRSLSLVIQRSQHESEIQEAGHFNQAALDALSVNLAILDDQGTILKVNRAWRNFALANAGDTANLCEGVNYLVTADTASGKDSEDAISFAAGIRSVLHGRENTFSIEYPCHAPHEKRWFLGRVSRFLSRGKVYLVVAHENITLSKQAELRQSARSKVLEQFSKALTLEDIFAAIIPYVEQIFPGHPVSILKLDETGRRLHLAASIGLPDFYNLAIKNLEIGAGVGSCGAAAYTGQRVVVEDIQAHPNWTLYKELAARAGLGACWSEPILSSNGRVLGTFAVYDARPAIPDINDLRHLEDAARLVGLVLERQQADEALHQSHAQLEQRVEERTAQLAFAKHRLEDKIIELEKSQDYSRDLAARYRIVADNTYDWEFWLDLDGQFLYSSPSCRRITGYGAEDFLGDPTLLEQIIHPDDLPAWQMHTMETTELEKKPRQIELRFQRADGSTVWIEHVCQPVFDGLGQFLGNRGSNRDISQRKQGEEALRRSESRFHKMVESITTYIYSVKIEEGHPLSTLHGPGCLGLTGYSAEEFAADAELWLDMVHPLDRELVTHQADRVLAGMTVLPLEHRMFRKDGSICWVKNMPVAQFNNMGDLTGYDGMITDISERKLAQQALLESHQFYRQIIAGVGEGIFSLDRDMH